MVYGCQILIILFRILTGLRKRESRQAGVKVPGRGGPQMWPIEVELIAELGSKFQDRSTTTCETSNLSGLPTNSLSVWNHYLHWSSILMPPPHFPFPVNRPLQSPALCQHLYMLPFLLTKQKLGSTLSSLLEENTNFVSLSETNFQKESSKLNIYFLSIPHFTLQFFLL